MHLFLCDHRPDQNVCIYTYTSPKKNCIFNIFMFSQLTRAITHDIIDTKEEILSI